MDWRKITGRLSPLNLFGKSTTQEPTTLSSSSRTTYTPSGRELNLWSDTKDPTGMDFRTYFAAEFAQGKQKLSNLQGIITAYLDRNPDSTFAQIKTDVMEAIQLISGKKDFANKEFLELYRQLLPNANNRGNRLGTKLANELNEFAQEIKTRISLDTIREEIKKSVGSNHQSYLSELANPFNRKSKNNNFYNPLERKYIRRSTLEDLQDFKRRWNKKEIEKLKSNFMSYSNEPEAVAKIFDEEFKKAMADAAPHLLKVAIGALDATRKKYSRSATTVQPA